MLGFRVEKVNVPNIISTWNNISSQIPGFAKIMNSHAASLQKHSLVSIVYLLGDENGNSNICKHAVKPAMWFVINCHSSVLVDRDFQNGHDHPRYVGSLITPYNISQQGFWTLLNWMGMYEASARPKRDFVVCIMGFLFSHSGNGQLHPLIWFIDDSMSPSNKTQDGKKTYRSCAPI